MAPIGRKYFSKRGLMEVERGERVYGKVLMKVAGQDFR